MTENKKESIATIIIISIIGITVISYMAWSAHNWDKYEAKQYQSIK